MQGARNQYHQIDRFPLSLGQRELSARHRQAINLLDIGESRSSIASQLGNLSLDRVGEIILEAKYHFDVRTDIELIEAYRSANAGKRVDPRGEQLELLIANDEFEPIEVPVDPAHTISTTETSARSDWDGHPIWSHHWVWLAFITFGLVGVITLTSVAMLIISGQSATELGLSPKP